MPYKLVNGKMEKYDNPKKPTEGNMRALGDRIAELETAITNGNAHIAKLETALADRDARIAELETALKAKK